MDVLASYTLFSAHPHHTLLVAQALLVAKTELVDEYESKQKQLKDDVRAVKVVCSRYTIWHIHHGSGGCYVLSFPVISFNGCTYLPMLSSSKGKDSYS